MRREEGRDGRRVELSRVFLISNYCLGREQILHSPAYVWRRR